MTDQEPREPSGSLLLPLKLKLDDLRGLFTGRLVLPILDGLKAGLHENGMATDDRALRTRPSGAITTSILTLPLMFIRRASSG